MDSWSSHHFNPAQMPTDQREHEPHNPSAITGSSSPTDGLFQMDASQPYYPCARFRSNPPSEALMALLQPGYTELCSSAASEPYEMSLIQPPSYLNIYYTTPFSTTAPMIASPSTMGSVIPGRYQYQVSEEQLRPVKAETITSPSFKQETFYHHSAQLEMSAPDFLTAPAAPLSPEFSSPAQPSLLLSHDSSSSIMTDLATENSSPSKSPRKSSEGTEPPYSTLIYDALKDAPGRKMTLQEIYSWFEKNTAKGKDQTSKGWQNSIRHNLSMNAGFEAVKEKPTTLGKKTVNFWHLTDEAARGGIMSTTRYRRQANHKRALSTDPSAPQRQQSGSKGGKVTKSAARVRHSNQDELRKERYGSRSARHRREAMNVIPPATPAYHALSTLTALDPVTSVPAAQEFDPSTVLSTNLPPGDHAVFCDTAEPGPDRAALDMGDLGWAALLSDLRGGLMTADGAGLQLGV